MMAQHFLSKPPSTPHPNSFATTPSWVQWANLGFGCPGYRRRAFRMELPIIDREIYFSFFAHSCSCHLGRLDESLSVPRRQEAKPCEIAVSLAHLLASSQNLRRGKSSRLAAFRIVYIFTMSYWYKPRCLCQDVVREGDRGKYGKLNMTYIVVYLAHSVRTCNLKHLQKTPAGTKDYRDSI